MLPSLSLPPLEFCLGTSPTQAEKVPSGSEGLGIGDARDQRCCQRRTDAGDRVQPLARRIRSMPGDEASVELQYLGLQCPQLTAECSHTRAGYLGEPVVGCIGDDFQQALDAPTSDRGDDPELGKIGADRIDDGGLLANE